MAVRPLVESGDTVLRQKTKKVRDFGPSLQELIDDMVDTMHHAPGVGLAAPQVGVSLRVAVIELPEDENEEEEIPDPYRGKLIVICNPEVVKSWGEEEQLGPTRVINLGPEGRLVGVCVALWSGVAVRVPGALTHTFNVSFHWENLTHGKSQ